MLSWDLSLQIRLKGALVGQGRTARINHAVLGEKLPPFRSFLALQEGKVGISGCCDGKTAERASRSIMGNNRNNLPRMLLERWKKIPLFVPQTHNGKGLPGLGDNRKLKYFRAQRKSHPD